jgi:hypothetical protein
MARRTFQPWNPSSLSPEEVKLQALQRMDPRLGFYGIQDEAALALQYATWQEQGAVLNNPNQSSLEALPVASSRGDFAKSGAGIESKALFTGDEALMTQFGFTQSAEALYNPIYYPNLADDPRNHDETPAPITVLPTQTTNPKRPRTVAAGYKRDKGQRLGIITVIFRDGTYYNYYEVSRDLWLQFKFAKSKGVFIRQYLDSKPRGYADISYIDANAQLLRYKIARTNQIRAKGVSQNEMWESRRQPSLERRLTITERAERVAAKNAAKAAAAKKAARAAKRNGNQAPVTANKKAKRK